MGDPVDAHAALATTARLFGRLLVRELDAATLSELGAAPIRDALAAVGVDLPSPDQLDQLAHEWLHAFLHPENGLPPVHSLYRDGNFDGDPAVAVRKIAKAAGLELAEGARNAAPDHLGCLLLLWADLVTDHPELARLVAEEHLGFADRALAPAIQGDSAFYAAVASAGLDLVRQIRAG